MKLIILNNEDLVDDDAVHFEISYVEASYSKLVHSAFGTPGRYVAEMAQRFFSRYRGPVFIFNPAFRITTAIIDYLVDLLKKDSAPAKLTVYSDKSGTPVGYMLPEWFGHEDCSYLSLLSAVDAGVDADYLTALYCTKCDISSCREMSVAKGQSNGFFYDTGIEKSYKWMAQSAVGTLNHHLSVSMVAVDDIDGKKRIRDAIPWAAIMPYHAGDALFISLASNELAKSKFERVVICDCYADIIHECATWLQPLSIRLSPNYRDGLHKNDSEFTYDFMKSILSADKERYFYYYCRPVREYRICDFHLIDQFAFALGHSPLSSSELIRAKARTPLFLPAVKDRIKALLHFEGGWPVKHYPVPLQHQLIKLLKDADVEVAVLTSKEYSLPGITTIAYHNLEHYRKLLKNYHILIGMDSFPVHFAAHVKGIPTICLFGNTKPVNSDAPVSEIYVFPDIDVTCAGCFGYNTCPKTNLPVCDNFPDADEVFAHAITMLRRMYGAKGAIRISFAGAGAEKEKNADAQLKAGKGPHGKKISELSHQVASLERLLKERERIIEVISNSKSWKITKPLRVLSDFILKLRKT